MDEVMKRPQYISKSALVAEIIRYKHKADERLKIKGRTLAEDCKDSALQNLCGNLLHFINTLEIKEIDSTDAFIEKAKRWLEKNAGNYVWCSDYAENPGDDTCGMTDDFVDDFENYMKGE